MGRNKLIVLVSLATAILTGAMCYSINTVLDNRKAEIGKEAVMLMYNFVDPYSLADNMKTLEEICTPEVFSKLTIDNEDRTLQTYLKFKGEPSFVKILSSGDNFVLYSLESKYISKERKFMFLFQMEAGKICDVREMECIDFVRE